MAGKLIEANCRPVEGRGCQITQDSAQGTTRAALFLLHPEDDAATEADFSLQPSLGRSLLCIPLKLPPSHASALIKASSNNKCSFIEVNQPRQLLNSSAKYRPTSVASTRKSVFKRGFLGRGFQKKLQKLYFLK